MSYQSVASGMLATVCAAVKNSLDGLVEMCGTTAINVGFLTFDSAVHFYQLREDHPCRQLVVSEVDEAFLPVPSTLLVNLVERVELTEDKEVMIKFRFSQLDKTAERQISQGIAPFETA